MSAGFRTVETGRLRLRAAEQTDVAPLVEALNDWAVAQWLVRPPYPYSEADAQTFIAWTDEPDGTGLDAKFVIADRETDALLGVVSITSVEGWGELGYWLRPSAAGFGYMAEAVQALLAHVLATHPGLNVYATIDPENEQSRNVLTRAGFQLAGSYEMQTRRKRGTAQVHRFELTATPPASP